MTEVCIHCGNPVEKINYGDKKTVISGGLENEYKHGYPRPYPVCSVNPLTSEDVETVEDE